MKVSSCLIFLPIFLTTLSLSLASKSVTEITMKPPSSKFLAKLMGMKKPKKNSKLQRKSLRSPKMGFLPGNSYSSLMEDPMVSATPRQDLFGLLSDATRMPSMENSPIYYVRLPPTPYMYTPGLGYVSQPPAAIAGPLRTESFHGNVLNPFMNLPVNFLSNGQPNGAYDFSMPELLSNTYPGKGFLRQEPPIFGRRHFFDDSKFNALKGRFDFNGRPDGLYMLPESPFMQASMFK